MLLEPEFLLAYINSTGEERKNFWDSLTAYCEENNIATSFYCPYVPLQIVNGTTIDEKMQFKTRYGIISK